MVSHKFHLGYIIAKNILRWYKTFRKVSYRKKWWYQSWYDYDVQSNNLHFHLWAPGRPVLCPMRRMERKSFQTPVTRSWRWSAWLYDWTVASVFWGLLLLVWWFCRGEFFSSALLEFLDGSENEIDKDRLTEEKHTNLLNPSFVWHRNFHKEMMTQRKSWAWVYLC